MATNLKRLTLCCFVVFFALLLSSCTKKEPDDLRRAADYVQWNSAPWQRSKGAFRSVYPDQKPSEFLEFINSDVGAAETLLITDEAAEQDNQLKEEARGIHQPLFPNGVELIYYEPDPKYGRQIVVQADDERDMIIVKGYGAAGDKPLFVREIPFRSKK